MAGQFWKEAASLIIISRTVLKNKVSPYATDFSVTCLKRSRKSVFMPEAHVFPGGVIDESDFSDDWLKVFERHGFSHMRLKKEFCHPVRRPELYRNKPLSGLLPEIAFRICAVRETFEECGLLLLEKTAPNSLSKDFITIWRERVHNDASQFISLFQELEDCPSICSLYEWSGWLTPTTFYEQRRYDTAFYITFVDTLPKLVEDDAEITRVSVRPPMSFMEQMYKKEFWLPPPQIYEISRLLSFSDFDVLKSFAEKRKGRGFERWLPVRINAEDGVLSVLPGDDLYPKCPDVTGQHDDELSVQNDILTVRESSHCAHRFEIYDVSDIRLFVKNYLPTCNHVLPSILSHPIKL